MLTLLDGYLAQSFGYLSVCLFKGLSTPYQCWKHPFYCVTMWSFCVFRAAPSLFWGGMGWVGVGLASCPCHISACSGQIVRGVAPRAR